MFVPFFSIGDCNFVLCFAMVNRLSLVVWLSFALCCTVVIRLSVGLHFDHPLIGGCFLAIVIIRLLLRDAGALSWFDHRVADDCFLATVIRLSLRDADSLGWFDHRVADDCFLAIVIISLLLRDADCWWLLPLFWFWSSPCCWWFFLVVIVDSHCGSDSLVNPSFKY